MAIPAHSWQPKHLEGLFFYVENKDACTKDSFVGVGRAQLRGNTQFYCAEGGKPTCNMRGRTCGRFTLKKKDARCLLVRGRRATCGPLPTVVIRSRLLLLDVPPGCSR
ncbi:hypothetical protein CEXT_615801 [Caerostris extrusa]|uniref:Uncharacterized protein n=1 Tax=Caerostris extrusa TaxID=172846 RepID=A0AAV4SHQ1_CAEEX|nr:hypothetical protein CEXT_615801 [Caerostris extrusa]